MGVMFYEEEYVVCGVEILVLAKEAFFRLRCVSKAGIALPKLHVFRFGDYVGIHYAIYVDAMDGICDVGLGVGEADWGRGGG